MLRRLCTPKPASGKLEVSQEIYRQWKCGGVQRRALLDTLIASGGDKDLYAPYAQFTHAYYPPLISSTQFSFVLTW